MAKGKGDTKVPRDVSDRLRLEMAKAIDELWRIAEIYPQCVRIQVTFLNGETIGQRRELRK